MEARPPFDQFFINSDPGQNHSENLARLVFPDYPNIPGDDDEVPFDSPLMTLLRGNLPSMCSASTSTSTAAPPAAEGNDLTPLSASDPSRSQHRKTGSDRRGRTHHHIGQLQSQHPYMRTRLPKDFDQFIINSAASGQSRGEKAAKLVFPDDPDIPGDDDEVPSDSSSTPTITPPVADGNDSTSRSASDAGRSQHRKKDKGKRGRTHHHPSMEARLPEDFFTRFAGTADPGQDHSGNFARLLLNYRDIPGDDDGTLFDSSLMTLLRGNLPPMRSTSASMSTATPPAAGGNDPTSQSTSDASRRQHRKKEKSRREHIHHHSGHHLSMEARLPKDFFTLFAGTADPGQDYRENFARLLDYPDIPVNDDEILFDSSLMALRRGNLSSMRAASASTSVGRNDPTSSRSTSHASRSQHRKKGKGRKDPEDQS